MQERIVIAINNSEVSERLKSLLLNEGYNVVASTRSGNELIRIVRNSFVNVVIIGYKLTDMTVMDVYNNIGELTKFLAIVNEQNKGYIQDHSDIFCVNSPINNLVLSTSLDMIVQSERKLNTYKKKIDTLEKKIEERKIVEKAKGKLMKDDSITEEEAFRYIQKEAMDNRKTLIDIAKEILIG